MSGGISLSGAPVGRWRLVHGGRRLEVETERAGWDHTARLYADGERLAEATGFPKVTLPFGELEVVAAFDAMGLVTGQAARCVLRVREAGEDGESAEEAEEEAEERTSGETAAVREPVAFEPPAGTRAARREAFARAHPELYASRHVAAAVGRVLFPLLGLGVLVKLLLALVPWPKVALPDVDLPSVPWPDVPWPDAPWPDLPEVSAPSWARTLLAAAKVAVPVLIAVGVAAREVERRKRSAAQQGEQAGAGERDHDGRDGRLPPRGRAGASQGEVVRGDGAGDVAEDDGVDLDLRDEGGSGEVVVDTVAGGAEQVQSRPEGVAGEDERGLALQDEEREVVGEGVAEGDRQQGRGEPRGPGPGVRGGGVLAGQPCAEPQRRDVQQRDGADGGGQA